MTKSWNSLKAKYFNADELAEIETETHHMIAEMPLNELRAARKISQMQLAASLGIKQPTVAKLERRADMYVSTLRNVVRAMGGDLEIIAHFPEGDVRINQFQDLAKPDESVAG
jgi:DNA-binding Xre family transcriptional regulator